MRTNQGWPCRAGMNPVFLIEETPHCELGRKHFPSVEAAFVELKRLSEIPWDQPPNRAPCRGWRTCRRDYAIVKFDQSVKPWNRLQHIPALMITSRGIQWKVSMLKPN